MRPCYLHFNGFPLQIYRETDFSEEKNRISTCLGAVKSHSLLQRVLDFSISDQVRSQDSVSVIATVAGNKNGRELAWKFFQDNFDLFKERYSSSFLGSSLVKAVSGYFASEEKARQVESFFVKNQFAGTEMAVKQTVESIRINSNWLSRDSKAIQDYIKGTVKAD